RSMAAGPAHIVHRFGPRRQSKLAQCNGPVDQSRLFNECFLMGSVGPPSGDTRLFAGLYRSRRARHQLSFGQPSLKSQNKTTPVRFAAMRIFYGAIVLAIVLARPARAQVGGIDLDRYLRDSVRLDAGQVADLQKGRAVAKLLPSASTRDVAIFGIVAA